MSAGYSVGYSAGYSAGYSVGYSETGFIKPNPAWVYQNMAFARQFRRMLKGRAQKDPSS